MVVHVFNSSVISGPETLVIPSLAQLGKRFHVIMLREARIDAEKNRGVDAYLDGMGVSWSAVVVKKRWDPTAATELARQLQELHCEIAHAHDVKASTYLLKAARLISERKFPIVTTHHGISARLTWKLRAYELFYSFLVASRFERVLTVCTADHERLRKRGFSESRLRLHLNGVDRPLVEAQLRTVEQAQIRGRWVKLNAAVRPQALLLGVVARLAKGKRHDLVIEVAAELRRLDPELNFQFLIFGSGPLEADLKHQSRLLGLDREVVWMGYDTQVGNEMAGFDALISLSSAEGLPVNLIEAGWAGTPVFATGVDGVLDLINAPAVGRVTAPSLGSAEIAVALRNFLSSPADLKQIGRSFQARVQTQFSGRAWFNRLIEIYRELRPGLVLGVDDCSPKTRMNKVESPLVQDCEAR